MFSNQGISGFHQTLVSQPAIIGACLNKQWVASSNKSWLFDQQGLGRGDQQSADW